MSSLDFLSSLKNTNYTTTNKEKEKTYDYNYDFAPTTTTNNYSYLKEFGINNYTNDYSSKGYDFGKKNQFLIENNQSYKTMEQPQTLT